MFDLSALEHNGLNLIQFETKIHKMAKHVG